ncbi:MAG: hypothetical protein ACRDQ5_15855 [Sciscionella sp.]
MATRWPDTVDEILAGDQMVALAFPTQERGVVITPVIHFGTRDHAAGTVTVNSSVAMWQKLDQINRDPNVALAFHTREHGFSGRPEFVLVQGTATLSEPMPGYPAALGENWERFGGPRASGPLWNWWLRVYHTRVEIEIVAERVIVWSNLTCTGPPEVYGSPLSVSPPPAQRPPEGRPIDHVRAALRVNRLSHVLLGWLGVDRRPTVVPVEIGGVEQDGIILETPAGTLPQGDRRAGLTAHSFSPHGIGQNQRVYTGWLEPQPAWHQAGFTPYTETGHKLLPAALPYRFAVGLATRRGLRQARRAGAQDTA